MRSPGGCFPLSETGIRRATAADADRIRDIAGRAYARYVPRIGREPAPMTADFAGHIERGEVNVAVAADSIAGFIVLYPRDDDLFVENVAVDPASVGKGIGGALMAFAEAEAWKHDRSAIRLYTNVMMHENFPFYDALGYRRTHEAEEAGFRRVYFEKVLEKT